MKLIKDLDMRYPTPKSKKKYRYGLYECPMCLKHFETLTKGTKSGHTTKCKSCASRIKNTKHGMSRSRLYRAWASIKQRCCNKNDIGFKDYGGRGVIMCREWEYDFTAFRDWALVNGYSDTLTIDRRDNDGNYEPSNCRWTTKTVQSRNTRRIHTDNTSGYRGVHFSKCNKKWQAGITVNNKQIYIGSYLTAKQAGQSYDNYVTKRGLEHTLNFPRVVAI